jgi:hypothetical protein
LLEGNIRENLEVISIVAREANGRSDFGNVRGTNNTRMCREQMAEVIILDETHGNATLKVHI